MSDSILKEYLDIRFYALEDKMMSELSDKIAEVNRSFDDAHTRVMDAIDALRAEVAEAKAKATTAEDLANLDSLDVKIDALDPTTSTTLPPPV